MYCNYIMLIRKNLLYKRKIIGGSLLGNLFDKAKGVISSATKAVMGNIGNQAKNILKTGTSKVLSSAKDLAKDTLGVSALTKDALIDRGKQLAGTAFEKGKQIVADKTHSLASKLGEKAVSTIQNAATKAKVPAAVKEKITELTKSPAVKKVLTEKAKEIVKQSFPKVNSNSTAILSNLIAGSGIKRIR